MQKQQDDPMIGLHLDLKGVQFRPEYLPQLLADAAAQGINTLLVEYEDMFPFSNLNIAADKDVVWSREQLEEFLAEAKRLGLEIIPLQQCLGHLQYLLMRGYEEFAIHSIGPNTLDISNSRARDLMRALLREIIEAHPASRYVMLGMDEASSLVEYADENHCDVLELFLEWLDELCALCESYNKVPLIWDDMLVDHLSEASLSKLLSFKERVVLVSWDYTSHGEQTFRARIGGWRISREWLNEPTNPDAPAILPDTKFIEDLPPFVLNLIAPDRRGRAVVSMFQADLWTRLGFQVIGASSARQSGDGPVLPAFNASRDNIHAWSRACERNNLVGQIATSWARGNTFGAPHLLFDLTWPLINEMARSMGAQPADFFDGLPRKTVNRIVQTLGRCREDWRIEDQIAAEMQELAPDLRTHQYEWKSLSLMACLLSLHHRCELADAHTKNVVHLGAQWPPRFAALREELDRLQPEIKAHFSQRYYGAAFEEWLDVVFEPQRHWLQRREESTW